MTETPTFPEASTSDMPHLTTVEAIQAATAVPTTHLPPREAFRAVTSQPSQTRVDPDSTEYALLTLAWAKREQAMQQAEAEFSTVAKKVATELVAFPKTATWKIGVDVDETNDRLQFTVLVWP